jgi:hypothetical protein
VSIRRAAVRRQSERASRATAAADDEESIMHIHYQFLAAMENDRLRTVPHRQGLEDARRDHAARLAREQGFGTGRPRRSQTGGLKGGRPPFGKRLTRAFGRRAAGAAA